MHRIPYVQERETYVSMCMSLYHSRLCTECTDYTELLVYRWGDSARAMSVYPCGYHENILGYVQSAPNALKSLYTGRRGGGRVGPSFCSCVAITEIKCT